MPLSNLNSEQLSAATCGAGYNLIIASAGTGKTSTIVGRIATLINSGVNPSEILLLTGRPGEPTPAKKMQMSVENTLSRVFSGVKDASIPI